MKLFTIGSVSAKHAMESRNENPTVMYGGEEKGEMMCSGAYLHLKVIGDAPLHT